MSMPRRNAGEQLFDDVLQKSMASVAAVHRKMLFPIPEANVKLGIRRHATVTSSARMYVALATVRNNQKETWMMVGFI